ncbi:MAG: ATP-binding cassette domain-containing protein [Acidobacteria bacterium]|nr:ATP-binding cassette domain-containing protein [Acidobacteriota bacterium]
MPLAQNMNDAFVKTESQSKIPRVEFRDVCLAFGDKIVLDGVSFRINPGEMKVILGQSGSGKSTILRLVLGLLKPNSGEIYINGEEVAHLRDEDLSQVRQKMSIVFQEGALFDSLSVYENIAYRPRELGWPPEKIDAHVQRVMEFARLGEVADEFPEALSGGTRRLVAIARAMVDNPEIILFDEPTVGLDPPTARRLCEAAVRLRDLEAVTTMFVTHRLADVRYLASHYVLKNADGASELLEENGKLCLTNTRFLMINEGKIVFDGTDEQLWQADDKFLHSFTHEDEE